MRCPPVRRPRPSCSWRAWSRKVHGASGTFDLPLSSVASNPTTEPRQGPTHTIVFTFDGAVTAGTATIIEGTATAGAPTFSGNDMSVPLTGVANAQYVTVAVSGVTTSGGGTGGATIRIGFLAGDVNQSRVVAFADLGLVNAQLAQMLSATNFLKDVNASGTLTVADKGVTNTHLTQALLPARGCRAFGGLDRAHRARPMSPRVPMSWSSSANR